MDQGDGQRPGGVTCVSDHGCRRSSESAVYAELGMAAQKYDSSKKRVGRPRKKKDIRKLVIAMALANLGWGYTKIRDALRTGLKIEIGRTTVANILLEEGIEPAPEREKKRTWKQFMNSHWETLYACDFFSVEALGGVLPQ